MRSHRPSAVGEDVRPAWQRAGWTRPPANSRESRLLREGKPQPLRKERIPPCRTCGGKRFSVKRRSRPRADGHRLQRYCMDCAAAYALKRKNRNRARVRELDRASARRRREEMDDHDRELVRERGRQRYANRTPEQVERDRVKARERYAQRMADPEYRAKLQKRWHSAWLKKKARATPTPTSETSPPTGQAAPSAAPSSVVPARATQGVNP